MKRLIIFFVLFFSWIPLVSQAVLPEAYLFLQTVTGPKVPIDPGAYANPNSVTQQVEVAQRPAIPRGMDVVGRFCDGRRGTSQQDCRRLIQELHKQRRLGQFIEKCKWITTPYQYGDGFPELVPPCQDFLIQAQWFRNEYRDRQNPPTRDRWNRPAPQRSRGFQECKQFRDGNFYCPKDYEENDECFQIEGLGDSNTWWCPRERQGGFPRRRGTKF